MTTVTCPATPVATISAPPSGLTFSQISRGSGVTCSTAGGSISGSGFNGTLATNLTNNAWYTFSITSDATVTFTLSSLNIVSRVSTAAGSPNVSVQYSIGGGAKTAIGSYTPTTSAATYTITPGAPIAVGASQVLNIFIVPNSLNAATTTCRVENNTSATVTAAAAGSVATLANITQPAGSITQGNNDVVLSGFTITPSVSINFTGVTVSGSGTATSTDITDVRIFRDNNADGIINGADASVSGAGLPYAASIPFTISGETGFSTVRNYLIVANVAGVGVSTPGRTVTASVGSGAFTTNATTNTGSATGNSRNIIAPPGTSTISAGAGTEPATISSLINTQGAALLNFDITILDDGATPLTDAAATQISQMIFNQGTGNTVANWTLAIAGAELSDGTNTLTGTINSTNITFSAIPNTIGTLGYVADDAAKTYTLKVWLNADMTTLKTTIDGLRLVFRIQTPDVTVTGSQLATAQDQNSGAGNNAITVAATALAYVQNATSVAVNVAMAPAVTVSAVDANGNRDLDFTSQVRITSTGTLTGSPVDVAAITGLATFNSLTHTATGSGLTLNAERTGTLDWDITSAVFNVTTPPTMTELVIPQYIGSKSASGTNNTRVPISMCVRFDNLLPNQAYDLGVQLELAGAAPTSFGAGNVWNGTAFSNSTVLNAFTTDGAGTSPAVWLYFQPTGNASRFDAAQVHNLRIKFVTAGGTLPTDPQFIGIKPMTALDIASTARTPATTDDGAFLKASVPVQASGKYALVYDNIAGTGDPLFASQIRTSTYTSTTQSELPASVNDIFLQGGTSAIGDFASVVPIGANNANGVRRIEIRNADNSLFTVYTSADGKWGTGADFTTIARRAVGIVDYSSVQDLTVNNSIALSTATAVKGTLTVNTGATLTTGGNLTLKSDATGTARVASSAGTISGDVTVERYINSDVVGRKWHLLSGISTVTSQNIFQSWQESAGTSNNLGTWITSGASVLPGYDATSVNNSSLLRHNPAVPAWVIPAATNTGSINDNQGYMLFVRGDRNATAANALTAPTVLRTTGGLRQGLQTGVTILNTNPAFTLLGNPYASPVDFDSIFVNTANLSPFFTVWDPTLAGTSGVGGFRAVQRTGPGVYTATPSTGSDNTLRYLHSGQAFFVKTDGVGDASIAFGENYKASSLSVVNPIVAGGSDQQLYTSLLVMGNGGTENLADAVRVRFSDAYTAATTDDAPKIGNFNENISSYRNNKKLIVELRPMINKADTIFLFMSNMTANNYRFKVSAIDFVQSDVKAWLQDAYTGKNTPLDLTGNTLDIDFSVTSDAASANNNRFRIVFDAKAPQPQTVTSISAAQQGDAIAVQWKAANQYNMKQYELERSTDGINYTKVNTQAATGTNGSNVIYNWLDVNPVIGSLQNPATNFYRIRSIDLNAVVKITDPVSVKMGKGSAAITVYPNPVTGSRMSLKFTDMEKGLYQVRLFNTMGQIVFTSSVNHNGGTATRSLIFDNDIAKGNYRLQIIKPDNSKTIQSIIITE